MYAFIRSPLYLLFFRVVRLKIPIRSTYGMYLNSEGIFVILLWVFSSCLFYVFNVMWVLHRAYLSLGLIPALYILEVVSTVCKGFWNHKCQASARQIISKVENMSELLFFKLIVHSSIFYKWSNLVFLLKSINVSPLDWFL